MVLLYQRFRSLLDSTFSTSITHVRDLVVESVTSCPLGFAAQLGYLKITQEAGYLCYFCVKEIANGPDSMIATYEILGTSALLLSLGIVRTLAWTAAVINGVHQKKRLQTAVGICGTSNSLIFALYNSHIDIPQWVVDVAVSSGVPIVVGIVGVMILNSSTRKDKSRWDW